MPDPAVTDAESAPVTSTEPEVAPAEAAPSALPDAPAATEAPAAAEAPDASTAAAELKLKRVSEWTSDRSFADFPISPEVLKGVRELGYDMATPVQAATIDPALAGRDLLVRAKTGTGKTAAFCVPVVERVEAGARSPRAIVLAPTRELAIQVAQECAGIAKYKDLRIAAIYGGVGFGPQEQALRDGAEIVVGTPGRVLDHARRGTLDLSKVQFAVLDEADEMLSMGFLEDVRKILDRTPKDRQSLFVSATINESIKNLIRSYLRDPEEIYLSVDGDNVSSIAHVLYETSPDYHKARALLDLIEKERPHSAIIFCNTREDVNTVYTFLDRQGLGVEMISGELPQSRREKVMARVKAGAVQYLVSTDVAARGIDISDLSHVVNYALPEDPSVYLHRCGRTGRIGKTGTALTLAGGADFSTRLTLERQHKILFEVRELPTPQESRQLQAERIARQMREAAGNMAYEAYVEVAKLLRDRPDSDVVLAVAVRAFQMWDRQRRMQNAEESEESHEGERPREERDERPPRGDRGDRPPRREDRDGRRDDRGPRRDDRPRGEDRPREDRPRGEGRLRDDRPRDDRPRDDRPRDDRPRDDRPREDRPREDRPREDRPRGDDRPREDRKREDRPRREPRPADIAPPKPRDEDAPDDVELESDEESADPTDVAASGGEDGEAKKKRRRRRRRKPGAREGGEGATSDTAASDGGAESGDTPADAAGAPEASEPGAEAESSEGDGTKRRRRRRRTPREGGEALAAGEGSDAPSGDAPTSGSSED